DHRVALVSALHFTDRHSSGPGGAAFEAARSHEWLPRDRHRLAAPPRTRRVGFAGVRVSSGDGVETRACGLSHHRGADYVRGAYGRPFEDVFGDRFRGTHWRSAVGVATALRWPRPLRWRRRMIRVPISPWRGRPRGTRQNPATRR